MLLISLITLCDTSFSQVSNFNFTVSTVDETCSGNGSISMSVSGTQTGSTIFYTLYEYPDIDVPLAQTSATSFNNLEAGSYLVIATQILGASQGEQQANATVADLTTQLDFQVTQSMGSDCSLVNLIIEVTSGEAVTYEIFSGPLTFPSQTSNTFFDVPNGTYSIRVFDDCGNALSKNYTVALNNESIEISPVSYPVVFNDCDTIEIGNTIFSTTGNDLLFPLSISYTIFPPGGNPSYTINEIINNGSGNQIQISQTINLYNDEIFDIEIEAIDNCGNNFLLLDEINPNPELELTILPGSCYQILNLALTKYVPPYTIQFIENPIDFNPTDFSTIYPGPYSTSALSFENSGEGVPYGNYNVQITDSCGRIASASIDIEEEEIIPIASPSSYGCGSDTGYVQILIPDREIVQAIFTVAPDDYQGTLPHDVSEHIINGLLHVDNLPFGIYTVSLTDNCGGDYLVSFNLTQIMPGEDMTILTTPNCLTDSGTLRIQIPGYMIESVLITSAPSTFNQEIPYDFSQNINTLGAFFTNSLPVGNYSILITDSCGFEYPIQTEIIGYQTTPNSYYIERNCGSFNLGVFDDDASVISKKYWFQKFIPEENSWGHPYTEELYQEGELPNTGTAVELVNEEILYNIFLTGNFRILKSFQSYYNNQPDQYCFDILTEFEISSDLIVQGIYNLDCQESNNNVSDVIIDVLGVEPYNFSIISPISLDNGSNNIFTNLSYGTYEFRVEDACGSYENIIVNLEDLLPVVFINTPNDLFYCLDSNEENLSIDLTQQNESILAGQDPNDFTITYHQSQNDADLGINPIPDELITSTNLQSIYVRVIHNTLNICYATTSFQIEIGIRPSLTDDETMVFCEGEDIILYGEPGYSNYSWSTGETTPNINVSESGIYTVTISNFSNGLSCDSTKSFTVNISSPPIIEDIVVNDWNGNNNLITIYAYGANGLQFSLDGFNYQTSNTFENLSPGHYVVYVNDLYGCGPISTTVSILGYLSFFTPNGDGDNDYWQILEAIHEPHMEIVIFDRYGKILTAFKGNSQGWDGTYNGELMPTNDYWFLVTRNNGQIHRGHFTLKR